MLLCVIVMDNTKRSRQGLVNVEENRCKTTLHPVWLTTLRSPRMTAAPEDLTGLISLHVLRRPQPWFRRALDRGRVSLLVGTSEEWPPILVSFPSNIILDGVHRVAAAELLGQTEITADYFYGSASEAEVESIRRNVSLGLPLSMSERLAAARRVIASYPDWSDRRLAEVCGLSSKTVARRRHLLEQEGRIAATPIRMGNDGRRRAADLLSQRARIREALQEHPTASLRAIAKMVSVTSPDGPADSPRAKHDVTHVRSSTRPISTGTAVSMRTSGRTLG